jgi:uncharacterized protein (TIGR01777 family)
MRRIVITGGTGFIGSHLSPLLEEAGYEVVHLSRSNRPGGRFKSFYWDPEKGYCNPDAFQAGDTIIHLAGANLGEKRWTDKRKREIIGSRSGTAGFVFRSSVEKGIMPSAFISASGVNIYGSVISDRIFIESDPPSGDFLGETCSLWEAAAEPFREKGIRVVHLRSAVVIAGRGSAVSKLTAPASFGLVVRLAPGNQYFPWIHIDDLCRIYLKAAVDNNMTGPYNAVAPEHITHDELMLTVAGQKKLPVFLPHVPVWLLHLVLGEMAVMLTTGSRISADRLLASGFEFRYAGIASALWAE